MRNETEASLSYRRPCGTRRNIRFHCRVNRRQKLGERGPVRRVCIDSLSFPQPHDSLIKEHKL